MRPFLLTLCLLFLTSLACGSSALTTEPAPADRSSAVPTDRVKQSPESDVYPPKSTTSEYANPVPLPYPVNSAGAEDSAFVMPDGNTLYVWFTPSPQIPPEKQLFDGVTGIYVFHKQAGGWSEPERITLQDPDKVALNGCEFVRGDRMWFCTAREGFTGMRWYIAEFEDGEWRNWKPADFNLEYEVGELHITADGRELYFHSLRPGGKGEYDIWVSQNIGGEWGEPVNLEIVNSSYGDGWPFITENGLELWFTRIVGAPELWRSKRVDGEWTQPEKMFAPFAGEASLDNEGNVYFTHHFYKDNVMLEADIYTAQRIVP
ncbi:MAG: hypothetical protein HND47_19425 [Chloroflexi bacterium]|nr:hypothetical protein [Chloroflexota bacterium]